MANFGAGMAGFLNGIQGGMSLAQQYKKADEEYKLNKVREQGIAEAKAMQAAAAPKVTDNGDMQNLTGRPQMSADPSLTAPKQGNTIEEALSPGPAANGLPTEFMRSIPPEEAPLSSVPISSPDPKASPMAQGFTPAPLKRFTAGNKEFDNKAATDKYVQDETPDLETFYAKTLVPKMKEAYMAQGKPEQAEAWEKYAEDTKTKGHMKSWSNAFKYAQHGKYTEAAKELMKLHPDFDDGLELVSSEATIGPDGQEGFTMVLRGEDGKEQKVYHDAKTITEVGLAQLSPVEMFNKRFSRQEKAEQMRAQAEVSETKDMRSERRQLKVVAERERATDERQADKIKADAAKTDKVEKGKDARQTRAAELQAERDGRKLQTQVKKGDSIESIRKAALSNASRDPMWTTLNDEERQDRLDRAVNFIKTGSSEGEASAQKGETVANPFQQGGLPNAMAAGKKGGIPVFVAGKGIVYR